MFPLLDTLVAVYEIGQFTLAADELKVSQSTVSSRSGWSGRRCSSAMPKAM